MVIRYSVNDICHFPILKTLQELHGTVVPFTGGLIRQTCSEIINWMYTNVSGVQERSPRWITDGSLQHAFGLWIEARDRAELERLPDCPPNRSKRDRFVWQQLWSRFMDQTGEENDGSKEVDNVDVDLESLLHL